MLPQSLLLSLHLSLTDTISLDPYTNSDVTTSIHVAPLFNARGANFSQQLKEYFEIESRFLSNGSIFYLEMGKWTYPFVVAKCFPGENAIVTTETQILQIRLPDTFTSLIPFHISNLSYPSRIIDTIHSQIRLPKEYPELLKIVGLPTNSGILLYGPHGCGKTAFLSAMSTLFPNDFSFLDISELLTLDSEEVGNKMRETFSKISQSKEQKGGILLLDNLHTLIQKRLLSLFFSLLDEILEIEGVVVVATTDNLMAIDGSLRRYGRFGTEIDLGNIEPIQKENLIKMCLNGLKVSPQLIKSILNGPASNLSLSEIPKLCHFALRSALNKLNKSPNDASMVDLLPIPLDISLFSANSCKGENDFTDLSSTFGAHSIPKTPKNPAAPQNDDDEYEFEYEEEEEEEDFEEEEEKKVVEKNPKPTSKFNNPFSGVPNPFNSGAQSKSNPFAQNQEPEALKKAKNAFEVPEATKKPQGNPLARKPQSESSDEENQPNNLPNLPDVAEKPEPKNLPFQQAEIPKKQAKPTDLSFDQPRQQPDISGIQSKLPSRSVPTQDSSTFQNAENPFSNQPIPAYAQNTNEMPIPKQSQNPFLSQNSKKPQIPTKLPSSSSSEDEGPNFRPKAPPSTSAGFGRKPVDSDDDDLPVNSPFTKSQNSNLVQNSGTKNTAGFGNTEQKTVEMQPNQLPPALLDPFANARLPAAGVFVKAERVADPFIKSPPKSINHGFVNPFNDNRPPQPFESPNGQNEILIPTRNPKETGQNSRPPNPDDLLNF